MSVLKISNLVKDYGSLRAVDHVSLDVKKGEILGLLGPNGAGKTSLINTIVTLEDFHKGEIEINGYNIKKHPRLCKSLTGYMPQEVINHGYFTLEEVMRHHSGYYGLMNNKDRIENLLKRFSLWNHRHKRIIQLSGGMKRRLLLAKALVHKPLLLLLDEPSTGVDIHLRDDIWNFVLSLKNDSKAILFTTHYLEEAEKLCDRIAIIHKGKIVRQNTTKKLIREFTLRKLVIVVNKEVSIQHKLLKQITGNRLEFRLNNDTHIGQLFKEISLDWGDVLDLQIQEGTLEDVFKDVLKNEGESE